MPLTICDKTKVLKKKGRRADNQQNTNVNPQRIHCSIACMNSKIEKF